jgi:hypothetical protein
MSYDIILYRRQPEQTWEEAREAEEAAILAQGDEPDPPLTREDLAAWERILRQAREYLDEVTVTEGDFWHELDHAETGIQLGFRHGSAGISVPYWTGGDAAAAVLGKAYYLALIVERETGLEAYDPQVEAAVAELCNGREKIGVEAFNQVAKLFGRRL